MPSRARSSPIRTATSRAPGSSPKREPQKMQREEGAERGTDTAYWERSVFFPDRNIMVLLGGGGARGQWRFGGAPAGGGGDGRGSCVAGRGASGGWGGGAGR